MKDFLYFLKLNAPACPGCRLDLTPEDGNWVCNNPICSEHTASWPIRFAEIERAHINERTEQRYTA